MKYIKFPIIFALLIALGILPEQVSGQCSVAFSSCPTSFTIVDCDHSGNEPINWPLVIANPAGFCDGFNLAKTGGPTIGSLTLLGTHQVSYQAQGLNANQQIITTADCVFSVSIVTDQQAPAFDYCPPNITVNGIDDGTGNCSAEAYWPTPISSDNGVTSVFQIGGSACGSTFSTGSSTVIYKAQDASGNIATCSFTVTVICIVGSSEPGKSSFQIRLSPNPTTGEATLEFGKSIPRSGSIVVSDLLGRTISQETFDSSSSQHRISLGSAPSGIYLVRMLDGGKVLWSGKLVKE